jgi:hypothetical protein
LFSCAAKRARMSANDAIIFLLMPYAIKLCVLCLECFTRKQTKIALHHTSVLQSYLVVNTFFWEFSAKFHHLF